MVHLGNRSSLDGDEEARCTGDHVGVKLGRFKGMGTKKEPWRVLHLSRRRWGYLERHMLPGGECAARFSREVVIPGRRRGPAAAEGAAQDSRQRGQRKVMVWQS